MARFNESTTEFWDTIEKEMMEMVIQNIEKENLLHEIDNAVENAESYLNELKDTENVFSVVKNDNLTTSTTLFNSLMEKSAFERQSSETKHVDIKVNDITCDDIQKENCTLTSSSKLVENNQLEETMYNCIPNFTSTPLKVKKAIYDKNGNAEIELQGISLYKPINNDFNLPQTDSSQSNDVFTKDNDCCNLMITIQNELCDINNGNNIELKEKINYSQTSKGHGNFELDIDSNIIDIKSKTGVCNNVRLDDNLKINVLCSQNNVYDVKNINIDCNDSSTIKEETTVVENDNKTVSNQNDEFILESKVLPSYEIKLTSPCCRIDTNKLDIVLEASIINTDEINKNCKKSLRWSKKNDLEFQQKLDNAEMHFNVSDLKINIPLDENEQEGTLKRPACDEYSNENKKIKLDDQVEKVNLDYDNSFAQDVTVENFTRLIFESQKTIDENDPNWRNIHDMSTAEDYFKYVTYQWQSMGLPEPHTNLSKIFVPCPESLQFMQNKPILHAETEALIQQATKNVGELNKLDKNKSEYILINKFYYEGNSERDVQYINKEQCEDLRIQEKILEFQQRFYK